MDFKNQIIFHIVCLKFNIFCCVHHRLSKVDEEDLPPANHTFDYKLEKDVRQVYRSIQRSLSAYKDEKRGPTYIAIQSPQGKIKIAGPCVWYFKVMILFVL